VPTWAGAGSLRGTESGRCRRLRQAPKPFLVLLLQTFFAAANPGRAQEIEPRAYSNAPVGVNFLIGGYASTTGALSSNPDQPVRDARFTTATTVLAYVRVLDVLGMSAKFDAILPYTSLAGTATAAERPIERRVDGFGDARLRLSVNLYGAPALSLEEFAAYRQDLIIGASLQVSAPTGQYDPGRLVNLGTNRWSMRPELGLSNALGRLTLEVAAAATSYTDNGNFFNGQRRGQEPVYGLQGHAVYNLRNGI